jgi:hypothetical protein
MLRLAALLALAACAAGTPAPPGAPLVRGGFRPEDRVVLGDFSTVQAVAASFDRVYVAYPSAVAIWEPLRRQWQVPRTTPTPNALARVQFAIVDPLDHSLWLAGDEGLVHFDPVMDRWERLPVPGRVAALAVDAAAPATGIWFRAGGGWFRMSPLGAPIAESPPASLRLAPTVEDAYRDLPALRTMELTMALGPGLVPGRVTAAAPNPDGSGWFIGTDRAGLLSVDRIGMRAERHTVGLPGEMIGALVAVPGGVWVATDEELGGNPAALSFVPETLTGTRIYRGDPALGLRLSAIRRIVLANRALWLATDRGVAQFDVDAEDLEWWTEADGLRDQRVTALHATADGLLVGTLRGLVQIDPVGEVTLPAINLVDPVYALQRWRDTVWVGTARGVAHWTRGSGEATIAPQWRGMLAGRSVLGLGVIGDTLVAITSDAFAYREPATGEWILGAPLSGTTGPLRTLHATAFGAWLGGDRGATLVTANGIMLQSMLVGQELPDAVTAITSSDQYLWVGTLRGLVRFALARQ